LFLQKKPTISHVRHCLCKCNQTDYKLQEYRNKTKVSKTGSPDLLVGMIDKS